MILKSLEDLENYKNSVSIPKSFISLKDINEVQISGGESTNNCNNKMFYWNFEPHYINELVNIYNNINRGSINSDKLYELECKLKDIARDMINGKTCPIEAILYASKVINNLILSNNSLIETLGKVISDIYKKNICKEYKETIKFILKEWYWDCQIMILINACGKIKDIELLEIVYENHTKGDTRLQALKSFMNYNHDICVDYTLKLISLTQESDNTEVQMAKYFIHNFTKNFDLDSIKKAEKYLDIENINKQAKKIISRIMPGCKNKDTVTLDTMIKQAKNWSIENNFESDFLIWMNNNSTRKNAFLAIRYSNSPNVEDIIISILEKHTCSSIEIGTALVTLAQWSSRTGASQRVLKLIEKNKKDITRKVYCNAAMCSLGVQEDSIELVKEFLEENYYDNRQIFSIIRDCAYKSSQLLRDSIKTVYEEYLSSENENKVIKAINGAYELCDNPKFNFKNITLSIIKNYIGINKETYKKNSDKVYMALMNLVERLLNDKNKDEFIDILFYIIEDEDCNKRIQFKAIAMLKKLSVDPPK